MKKGSDSKENDFMDEIVLTFSNKKSLLSSKKIERFIVFNVFLVLTVLYVWKNIDTLESRDFIEITLVWLAYGGYNSFMSFRDKKLDANKEPGPDEV
jgi:ABC-type enterochelin transport system permease subunit